MDQLNDELPEPLARAMKALDADAARAAARVDAARVADGVLRRMREGPVAETSRPWWGDRRLRVAAAVLLLAVGGAVALRLVVPSRGAELAVGLPDSLSAAQAQALLSAVDSMPALDADGAPALVVTMESLNEAELLTLLQSMESSEDAL